MTSATPFRDISDRVSFATLLASLGCDPLRQGRSACPVCNVTRNKSAFSVHERKGVWQCFASNHGGTKLDLVMGLQNCSKREAAEYIADLAGVDLKHQSKEEWLRRKRLLEQSRHEAEAFRGWVQKMHNAYEGIFWALTDAHVKVCRWLCNHPQPGADVYQWALRFDRAYELDSLISIAHGQLEAFTSTSRAKLFALFRTRAYWNKPSSAYWLPAWTGPMISRYVTRKADQRNQQDWDLAFLSLLEAGVTPREFLTALNLFDVDADRTCPHPKTSQSTPKPSPTSLRPMEMDRMPVRT